MRDDEIEWDDRKARWNLTEHGVSFDVACLVFNDRRGFERPDPDPDEGRYVTVGAIDDRLVTVVWTERGERIRIISAWTSTGYDRRICHGFRR